MVVRNHFALLRNLRNIQKAGVSDAHMQKVRDAFNHPSWARARILPFRFVTAARYVPRLEDAIELAMFKAIEGLEPITGSTLLLIDVSGSMDAKLSAKSDASRVDAAAGLAILVREKAAQARIATFSEFVTEVPARRGFALRDAIHQSQPHGGTYLARALEALKEQSGIQRLIVITDEQSHDGSIPAWLKQCYVVNVAPYKNGVSYRDGWHHVDGWSERVLDYIRELEAVELE